MRLSVHERGHTSCNFVLVTVCCLFCRRVVHSTADQGGSGRVFVASTDAAAELATAAGAHSAAHPQQSGTAPADRTWLRGEWRMQAAPIHKLIGCRLRHDAVASCFWRRMNVLRSSQRSRSAGSMSSTGATESACSSSPPVYCDCLLPGLLSADFGPGTASLIHPPSSAQMPMVMYDSLVGSRSSWCC